MINDINLYLTGKKLLGDDFSDEQIKEWMADEKEGYANLGAKNREHYHYGYHALNQYGYNVLPDQKFNRVLSIGGAYGDELIPILDKINEIYILDPSDAYAGKGPLSGKKVFYAKPSDNGNFNFPDEYFDLITCFGTLQHLPYVSVVLKESYRCLKRGNYALFRESINSMGDWRQPRAGLTKNSRGIPLNIFRKIISHTGYSVISENQCMFPLIQRISNKISCPHPYGSRFWVKLDRLLSLSFAWNYRYHAVRWYEKLKPGSVFYVLRKP